MPLKNKKPVKWDGTNYSLIEFLKGISQILNKKVMDEKNEKHVTTIEKAIEFIDTVKRNHLFNKGDFEDTRILIWRRSLGSLTKITNNNFVTHVLPYTDDMHQYMLGTPFLNRLDNLEFVRYTIPDEELQTMRNINDQFDYINMNVRIIQELTIFNEDRVFDYLRMILLSASQENIHLFLMKGDCTLVQMFKLFDKYKIAESNKLMSLAQHPWTENFQKSFNDFFEILDGINYKGGDEEILVIIRTRMELYTDFNVEYLLHRWDEEGFETVNGVRKHIENWFYNTYEKTRGNSMLYKQMHPSLLEGETPTPMDIGKVGINSSDKMKSNKQSKSNNNKFGKEKKHRK